MSNPKTRSPEQSIPLAEVYERHGHFLRKLAQAKLHDETEAWDVMQDTFLDYILNQPPCPSPGSLAAWLMQVAKNKVVDRIRARIRWSSAMEPIESEEKETALHWREAASKRDGELGKVAARHDLVALMQGESAETLRVVGLHYLEGLTLTEVGQELTRSRKQIARELRHFIIRAKLSRRST